MLAAAVLPCFWIFSDLGARSVAGDLSGHPYADWVDTYRDPRFAAATVQARAIVDDLAAGTTPEDRGAMRDAFRSACSYELSLFDDAWVVGAASADEVVPPRPVNGSATARATTNEVSEADNQG